MGRADVDPFVLYLMAMSEMENARQAGMTARQFAMSKGVPSTLPDAEAAQIDAFEYNMRTGKLPPGSENLKSVEEPSPSQETVDNRWYERETDESRETGKPDNYESFIKNAAQEIGTYFDSTYGIKGKAAAWGELKGGAEQILMPLIGDKLVRLGIAT